MSFPVLFVSRFTNNQNIRLFESETMKRVIELAHKIAWSIRNRNIILEYNPNRGGTVTVNSCWKESLSRAAIDLDTRFRQSNCTRARHSWPTTLPNGHHLSPTRSESTRRCSRNAIK